MSEFKVGQIVYTACGDCFDDDDRPTTALDACDHYVVVDVDGDLRALSLQGLSAVKDDARRVTVYSYPLAEVEFYATPEEACLAQVAEDREYSDKCARSAVFFEALAKLKP